MDNFITYIITYLSIMNTLSIQIQFNIIFLRPLLRETIEEVFYYHMQTTGEVSKIHLHTNILYNAN